MTTETERTALVELWRETRQSYRRGPVILAHVMDLGSKLAEALASAPSAPQNVSQEEPTQATSTLIAEIRRIPGSTEAYAFGLLQRAADALEALSSLEKHYERIEDESQAMPRVSSDEITTALGAVEVKPGSWTGGTSELIKRWRAKAAEHRASETKFTNGSRYHDRAKAGHHFSAATLEACANDLEALSSSAPAASAVVAERERVIALMETHAAKYLNQREQYPFREVLDWVKADARNGASSAPAERPQSTKRQTRRPTKENLRTARGWIEDQYSYFIDVDKDASNRKDFVNAIMEVIEAACVHALKPAPSQTPEERPADDKETKS